MKYGEAVKKALPHTLVVAVVLIAVAAFAPAAFGSGGSGGGEHGISLLSVAMQLFNFAILVGVLVFVGRKPFREFLKNRTETIERTLKEAREARELAGKALKEVEDKLKSSDVDLKKTLESARASGKAERERIIKEAGELAGKALEKARANIELELQEARAAVKREAVELALQLAEKKILQSIGKAEQKRLLDDSLEKLAQGAGGAGGGGGAKRGSDN